MGSVNQNESVWKPVSAFCFYEFREILVTRCSHPTMFGQIPVFGMLPKFSDRYAWVNSADPDQRSSLIRVYTVCHSVCIVWTHYSMVEPHSSNFRVITTNFGVSEYLGKITVLIMYVAQWLWFIATFSEMSVLMYPDSVRNGIREDIRTL